LQDGLVGGRSESQALWDFFQRDKRSFCAESDPQACRSAKRPKPPGLGLGAELAFSTAPLAGLVNASWRRNEFSAISLALIPASR